MEYHLKNKSDSFSSEDCEYDAKEILPSDRGLESFDI